MSPGSGAADSQDFELNLASIIDCFTVLITFMLASASFLSIGILDAGVAAAGVTADDKTPPPPVQITLELQKEHRMSLKVTGKQNTSSTINAAAASQWDYDELTKNLTTFKQQWPDVSAITVLADNDIEYRDIIKSMEAVRKTIPVVLLGGF